LVAILPCLVQSLSVNRLSDALSFNNIFVDHREFGFTPAPPPHTEEAKLARYVVHYSDWASMATISVREPTKGFPFSNVISMSDGTLDGKSTGIPYMYMTDMEMSTHDLHADNRMSLVLTLAQGDYCIKQALDPQDPPCARVILTGSTSKIAEDSEEAKFAKEALFTRHPNFIDYPDGHHFYFAKMNIEHICLLAWYGGAKQLSTEEYFNATLTSNNDFQDFIAR